MHPKYPLVYVEWADHFSSAEWHEVADIVHTPLFCLSVGWLLKDNEEGITLITSISDGQVGGTTFIMRPCIKKCSVLRKAPK